MSKAWPTVAEVAADLDVHPETVRRWIRSRELRAVNVAGWRVGPEALAAFLRRRENAPEPERQRARRRKATQFF